MHDSICEGVDLNDSTLFRRLVVLLAEGHAVSPERLAAKLEASREGVIFPLRKQLSIEWDETGNVAAPCSGVGLIE